MSQSEANAASLDNVVAFPSPSKESAPRAETSGFRSLGLSDALITAVENSGYTTPTPIQVQAIPLLLEGRDLLGQAQTGTGKTAAFALPLLERIDLARKQPQLLVLTPTRELAIQVADFFAKYSRSMRGLRVVPIYGGQDYQLQRRQLDRGVHVVVGTPGRVMDQMRRGFLKLDGLGALVLDEADEMLRMGFADDVEWVLTQTPEKRQIALFSATLPKPIRRIAQKHLRNPAEITIAQRTATADTVHQRYIVAAPHQKQAALVRVLEAEATDGVLVFVRTRSTSEPLARYLEQAGLKTAALSGDVAQKQRERIVESLRSGRIDVIVATDVAARGLDVQRISHVINYDLPYDSEAYVHRIGRTGRAGRSGEAILFVHPRERRFLQRLQHATRQTITPMEIPSNRVVNKRRIARFHETITGALENEKLDTFQSIVNHYQRESGLPMDKVAAALAVLATGETPLLLREDLEQVDFADESRRERGSSRSQPRKLGPRTEQRPDFRRAQKGLETYRIEVGRRHGVQPGNIVGAIANEAGIGSEAIGRITIFDGFSTVDLPVGMPREVLHVLKNVFVAGQKLRMTPMGEARPRPDDRPARKPRTHSSKPGPKRRTHGSKSVRPD
jgi:ATP-dependent RNA helicase DeaD